MEYIHFLLELLTHTKDVLLQLFQEHGNLIYAILFLIIFVETGLVIMPFLPGDSLLFTAGLLCAQQSGLNIFVLIPLLIAAAIIGDNLNYFVGKYFSEHVLSWKFKGKPLVNPEWINEVHNYFEKQGTKTIIIARFIPIVRTVTPFVSGVGKMNYKTFLPYDILGGILWVSSVTIVGYFLGNIPFVEKNLEKFILGIVFISILPMIIKAIQIRIKK
ncbi:MAG: VTT domain-containing protein [Sphingobacteriales bacterium]|mgnify:FL=1|jgi:membrane-associated protein|nr:VTT domain-containing protein [Sphingobacteriales bacterium]HNY54355.1 VTT domain-containing protein [Chitinophagales bacterium]